MPLILCVTLLGPVIVLPEQICGQSWHLGLWQEFNPPVCVAVLWTTVCQYLLEVGGVVCRQVWVSHQVYIIPQIQGYTEKCTSQVHKPYISSTQLCPFSIMNSNFKNIYLLVIFTSILNPCFTTCCKASARKVHTDTCICRHLCQKSKSEIQLLHRAMK